MSHSELTQRSDDIAQLKRHLGLSHMHYQDISLLAEQRRVLERWPLLAEIDALRTTSDETPEASRTREMLTV